MLEMWKFFIIVTMKSEVHVGFVEVNAEIGSFWFDVSWVLNLEQVRMVGNKSLNEENLFDEKSESGIFKAT